MKKMLVVGNLAYNESAIVEPILEQLIKSDIHIERIGGNTNFFQKEYINEVVIETKNGIINSLKDIDVVFFIDYWNFAIPTYNYLRSFENPNCKFIALFHGSVKQPDDVARQIRYSSEYEQFLEKVYDMVFIPNEQLIKDLQLPDNFYYVPFPTNEQVKRPTPVFNKKERIIFGYRFAPDKGSNIFIDYMKKLKEKGRVIETIILDKCPDGFEWTETELGFKYIGKQDYDKYAELCSEGGYCFRFAQSETFAYAVLDMMSFGLTPLVNDNPAYCYLPEKFICKSFEDFESKLCNVWMEPNDIVDIYDKIGDGDVKIAELIKSNL